MTRDVYYIAGYDPRGFRFYYSLFKKNLCLHGKKQEFELSKVQIKGFEAFWSIENKDCKTNYTFLAWNDIVKDNWHKGIFSILKDCLSFFKIYIITGLFIKFAKACKPTLVTGFYSFFYVLLSYLLVFFIIYLTFSFISAFTHASIAVLFSLLVLYLATKLILKIGNKTAAFWLGRICIFCSSYSQGRIERIDERVAHFVNIIYEKLKMNAEKKDYELIICSHSVGTILAITVIARLIKLCLKEKINTKALKILTLGECVPLMSYHKKSDEFRQDLNFLAQQENLFWLDFTSKIDGACFYKFNFLGQFKCQAYFLSTKFYKLYNKQNYAKIRKDKYKTHFLYLMASEISGEYDFFNFTIASNFLENKIIR